MANIDIFLDIYHPKKNGQCALKISISHNRQVRYVSLGKWCAPELWDTENNVVKKNYPNARSFNLWLYQCKIDAERAILDLSFQKRSEATLKDFVCAVKSVLTGEDFSPKDTFAHCLEQFAAHKKESTRKLYLFTLSRMKDFDPKAERLRFEDITKEWLMRFDEYLAITGPSKNYRNIHLRNIRAVFNAAIDDEITTAYPFRRFKIRPVPTPKRSLSVEQLRELFSYPVEEYAQRYVDAFKLIFMLCGINVVDLYNLSEISSTGRIEYNRAKTGKLYSIKVEPEAFELIEKYRGQKNLLNIADRFKDHRNYIHCMNKALQHIGNVTRSGLFGKKNIMPAFPGLSSYWARHTWATIAADLDIPDATISMALGHSAENSTTEIYIKRNIRKVDEANRRVLDWVLYGKR